MPERFLILERSFWLSGVLFGMQTFLLEGRRSNPFPLINPQEKFKQMMNYWLESNVCWRQQMNYNIFLCHKVVKLIRRYLEDVHGFVEEHYSMLCLKVHNYLSKC
ncbi:hypothetical protein LWI28_012834 [Acer negundo]|uniref:Uncharacterized protein n=1 Tax=Acer negundo TaxID=4023 RepID=A0AAD5J586_ACENE|nr:hypothetical protein LWI28_012834 [Acer negundo]